MKPQTPAPGYYERILTQDLAEALKDLPASWTRLIEEASKATLEPLLIAELSRQLQASLGAITHEDAGTKARLKLELTNRLLQACQTETDQKAPPQQLSSQGVLKALLPPAQTPTPPETGLLKPWLFTAAKGSPSLLSELAKELSDCDEVCVLVSFITLSGVRRLEESLKQLLKRERSTRAPVILRVLTTTYTGATEQAALDRLARLPNTQVRISLDGRRTRLHAKAWLFNRETGFGTAFIGSANFSAAALLGGLEWTVKLTQAGQADVFEKARAHFETLWNDKEFEAYDPDNPVHSKALKLALKREAGEGASLHPHTFFELTPKAYQQAMLDQLAHERMHGRSRNLVVAATGTGKTMIAAFDYRQQCAKSDLSARPRLLFVAHREEILRQSLTSFRAVLRDQDFGDLLCGGREPQSMDHLFASVQSVHSRDLFATHPADYWDIVIIDECHHLAAASFTQLVGRLRPKFLLGLTATPERGDGESIARFFDPRPDGTPSCELRLWQALDLQLLAPFEYHVADDPIDYRGIPWNQAGENKALENLIGTDKIRAQAVIDSWIHLVGTPLNGRTLAFCVSVKHAEFMAEAFTLAGIPALCLHGQSRDELRQTAPKQLRDGSLRVITTCDLYNEGVDLPFVDTILLLRPTQSPVIFQQQIGRGLRIHPGKTSCLILDFVGNTDQDFRFDRLYGAFLGMNRSELVHAMENDFAHLPAGCVVRFTRRSKEAVLERLKQLGSNKWKNLCRELASYCHLERTQSPRLVKFLQDQGIDPADLFREQSPAGWSALKRAAGLPLPAETEEETYFGRRLGSLLHLDAQNLIQVARKLADQTVEPSQFTTDDAFLAQMLAYQVDGTASQVGSWTRFLGRLRRAPNTCDELLELCDWLESRCLLEDRTLEGMEDLPLRLHAHYDLREILTAVGFLTAEKRSPFQAGVLALKERKTELLLVTLDKSEALHAAVAYHDYAISPELFHWQSQNSAGPHTMGGQRYLESPSNGWRFQLFVRAKKGEPYCALGAVTLQKAEGAKPMSITWKLQTAMPAELFRAFSVLRAA